LFGHEYAEYIVRISCLIVCRLAYLSYAVRAVLLLCCLFTNNINLLLSFLTNILVLRIVCHSTVHLSRWILIYEIVQNNDAHSLLLSPPLGLTNNVSSKKIWRKMNILPSTLPQGFGPVHRITLVISQIMYPDFRRWFKILKDKTWQSCFLVHRRLITIILLPSFIRG
jgi:hypothetical protein